MSHIYASPRPLLRVVTSQPTEAEECCQASTQALEAHDLGGAVGEICEECGAQLHLTIDPYGIYDFRCSKRGYSIKDSVAHQLASISRNLSGEKKQS